DRYLDLRRPVGLLAVSVMHFIASDEDPAGMVHVLMDRAAPGSHLVVSQVTPGGNVPLANAGYRVSSGRMVLRDVEQVRPWLAGLELVEPGLVLVNQWRLFDGRPAYVDFDPAMPAWVLGAVAKKP
ncbi:MAG TPA: SAM-dependent methyltransferase, partial [Propionibacteriaceae bacterium]